MPILILETILNKKDNKSIFAATSRKSNTESKFITKEWNILCGRGNFLIAVYLHLCNLFGGEIEIQLLIRIFEMIFASEGLGHFFFFLGFHLDFLPSSKRSFFWLVLHKKSVFKTKRKAQDVVWTFIISRYPVVASKTCFSGRGLVYHFLAAFKDNVLSWFETHNKSLSR